jgi:hypothetical protein
MARLLLLVCAALLAAAPAARAQDVGEEVGAPPRRHVSPTPWWLPRGASLGTYFAPDTLTPQLRLQWQWTVIQERVDAFVLVFEGGGGWAVARTQQAGLQDDATMRMLYQHPLLAGVAYRGTRPSGLHLGGHVLTGPLFYGARFDSLPAEDRVVGVLEARVQAGWKLGAAVYGLSLGYASAYGRPARSYAYPYIGGFTFGLFADWR